MQKFTSGPHTLWAPDTDEFTKHIDDSDRYIAGYIKMSQKRVLHRNILSHLFVDPPTYTILWTHGIGNLSRTQWYYYDGNGPMLMQDWINSVDGSADVIFIWACNPSRLSITAQRSVVIHPRKFASVQLFWKDIHMFRMFIPGLGYVDCNSPARIKRFLAGRAELNARKQKQP